MTERYAWAAGHALSRTGKGMTELVEVIAGSGFGHAPAAGHARRQAGTA